MKTENIKKAKSLHGCLKNFSHFILALFPGTFYDIELKGGLATHSGQGIVYSSDLGFQGAFNLCPGDQ